MEVSNRLNDMRKCFTCIRRTGKTKLHVLSPQQKRLEGQRLCFIVLRSPECDRYHCKCKYHCKMAIIGPRKELLTIWLNFLGTLTLGPELSGFQVYLGNFSHSQDTEILDPPHCPWDAWKCHRELSESSFLRESPRQKLAIKGLLRPVHPKP